MKSHNVQTIMAAGFVAVFGASASHGQSATVTACATYNWQGDINRDGYADLAIGVPHQTVDGASWAGEVHILFGSASGLSTFDQILNLDLLGYTAQSYDEFGTALAIGDFDNDGYNDLAIGVPGYSIGSISDTGVVVIVYGSNFGLNTADVSMFSQNTGGIADNSESNDGFGSSLASGDFNNDCYADLLIGVPNEDVNGHANAGVVHVLYGSSSGLKTTNSQLWYQDLADIEGAGDNGDQFGWVVAAGDFNGNGYDDAAIGAPGDLASGAGAVNILYGSASRLTATGDMRFYRGDSSGVDGVGSDGDEFGSALAVGDFNDDGKDDLAIGAYGTTICTSCGDGGSGLDTFEDNVGSVAVLYGSSSGLNSSSSRADQSWTQASSGISGGVEGGDWFGYALVAADFDGDGKDDVAIGVPGEAIDDIIAAGAVNVIYGSSSGLSSSGEQIWHQSSDGIEGGPEEDDWFGWALAAGDYNNDGKADLSVGVPQETVDGVSEAGCINVIYGLDDSSIGLDDAYNALWHRADSDILGSLQMYAFFGGSLGSTR